MYISVILMNMII